MWITFDPDDTKNIRKTIQIYHNANHFQPMVMHDMKSQNIRVETYAEVLSKSAGIRSSRNVMQDSQKVKENKSNAKSQSRKITSQIDENTTEANKNFRKTTKNSKFPSKSTDDWQVQHKRFHKRHKTSKANRLTQTNSREPFSNFDREVCSTDMEKDIKADDERDKQYPCQSEDRTHKITLYNLSNRVLTQGEKSLLEYGLTFIPTKLKVNVSQLLSDLREWERKMRLREYFYEDEEDSITDVSENTKSNSIENEIESQKRNKIWMPPTGRDQSLDLYIQLVKEDILKGIRKNGKMNI